jgi:hypothetical protein
MHNYFTSFALDFSRHNLYYARHFSISDNLNRSTTNMTSRILSVIAILTLLLILPLQAQNRETGKYWIYLRDKGPTVLVKSTRAAEEAKSRLSERAIMRRAKVFGAANLIQASDIALYRPYLDRLQANGIVAKTASRWLNAVSAGLTAEQLAKIKNLDFVEKIEPVRQLATPKPAEFDRPLPKKATIPESKTVLNYGASLLQNEQIKVPALHDAGIFGENVLVGMIDTGFLTQGHEAFAALEVLGEFDFISNDSVTSNQPGDVPFQQDHGTETLSVIAGFASGNLIGPAFKSKFLLAKTENLPTEARVEEDDWMAAVEWMEAQGVDVVSSSLGYRDFFDNPDENYSYNDLDGNTAVVTRAAQMATGKGVVVVTSAGNEGADRNFPYIGAPADGKDVLAVGAVTSTGERVNFSSLGPTFDGRIKPDVMAMGVGVTLVVVDSTKSYTKGNGTSYSCPLVGGVAALILSAHPELTPLQVNEALRMTASLALFPDNDNGYGLVNAREAIAYWGPAFSNRFTIRTFKSGLSQISVRCLVGKDDTIKSLDLHWRLRGENTFNVESLIRADSTLYRTGALEIANIEDVELYFTTQIPAKGVFTYPYGAPVAGVLNVQDDGQIIEENTDFPIPEAFTVAQNYPNPFILSQASETKIPLDLQQDATVSIVIYDLLGREVARPLQQGVFSAGVRQPVFWNGQDESGRSVATGIYFYQVVFKQANGETETILKKLAVIR